MSPVRIRSPAPSKALWNQRQRRRGQCSAIRDSGKCGHCVSRISRPESSTTGAIHQLHSTIGRWWEFRPQMQLISRSASQIDRPHKMFDQPELCLQTAHVPNMAGTNRLQPLPPEGIRAEPPQIHADTAISCDNTGRMYCAYVDSERSKERPGGQVPRTYE